MVIHHVDIAGPTCDEAEYNTPISRDLYGVEPVQGPAQFVEATTGLS